MQKHARNNCVLDLRRLISDFRLLTTNPQSAFLIPKLIRPYFVRTSAFFSVSPSRLNSSIANQTKFRQDLV